MSEIMRMSGDASVQLLCSMPAPLALNGSGYAGCMREAGHDGMHEIKISWRNELIFTADDEGAPLGTEPLYTRLGIEIWLLAAAIGILVAVLGTLIVR